MLGIGVGGTAEKAMEIAKEALLDPIDIQELQARGASNRAEELRLELFDEVNKSGIGAQGLGGPPRYWISKSKIIRPALPISRWRSSQLCSPRAIALDGSGPVALPAPKLEDPEITRETGDNVKRVNLALSRPKKSNPQPGDTLLLNGNC